MSTDNKKAKDEQEEKELSQEKVQENAQEMEDCHNEDAENNENCEKDSCEDKEDKKVKKKKKKRKSFSFKSKKSSESELEKKIQDLTEKNAEIKEKYLRLVAEYDNYRKRTAKEKLEIREAATGYVVSDLLTVIDDFDRALEYGEKSKDEESVVEGLKIIHKKFQDFLKAKCVEEIDAKHKEFDTDLHEAITKIPAPEEELKGKVVDVVQKGYKINDKVIRYSKVVVGE